MAGIIDQIIKSRGLHGSNLEAFCNPSYEKFKHDPFLLPDMQKAVDRLVKAKKKGELVYIYGDYDIDGLTATTLLLDAFKSFGIKCEAFVPNRFVEGYGLAKSAIDDIKKRGADLIITVDCGSLSHAEIDHSNSLGLDVIVTDHHSVAETMPSAVAVVNPKRIDHEYPFIDLAGVGVAFKLVQAMQQKMAGLAEGHEKWLLDLVALGTVCDVVQLNGENRANVYWGLKVLEKTRRLGIRALANVSGVDGVFSARALGFALGPRLNAAGRLETAQHALDLLTSTDKKVAFEIANRLDALNQDRRAEQDRITVMALEQAGNFEKDPILVLSHPSWSHGVIGIVAAKVLEALNKPTFVLQEIGEQSKGSARSFGDFSAVEAIKHASDWLIKGGGHKLAAGVTLKTSNIDNFRVALNEFYVNNVTSDQKQFLAVQADAVVEDIKQINFELNSFIKSLEPFGHGNPEPVINLPGALIERRREIGKNSQHLKLSVSDKQGNQFDLIGFNLSSKFRSGEGSEANLWFKLLENNWGGNTKLEGQIVDIRQV